MKRSNFSTELKDLPFIEAVDILYITNGFSDIIPFKTTDERTQKAGGK